MIKLLTPALLVLSALLLAGCPGGKPTPPKPPANGGHGSHEPPPGYCGVAVGDHFAHLAVKNDPATGTLEVVIYDGHFENPVRIKDESVVVKVKLPPGEFVEVNCKAVEDKLSGEKVGDTATFRGQADALKKLEKFDAVFMGATIKGQKQGEVPFPYPKGISLH